MGSNPLGNLQAWSNRKWSKENLPARQALALLALILIANPLLGFPAAANLAFLAPVTIATYGGGLKNGIPVFVATTFSSTMVLAYTGLILHGGMVNNVIIDTVLIAGAMLLAERTRKNLSDTID